MKGGLVKCCSALFGTSLRCKFYPCFDPKPKVLLNSEIILFSWLWPFKITPGGFAIVICFLFWSLAVTFALRTAKERNYISVRFQKPQWFCYCVAKPFTLLDVSHVTVLHICQNHLPGFSAGKRWCCQAPGWRCSCSPASLQSGPLTSSQAIALGFCDRSNYKWYCKTWEVVNKKWVIRNGTRGSW